MRFSLRTVVLAVAAISAACARASTVSTPPAASEFTLNGQYVLHRPEAATSQVRVGGLSGLASLRNGRELLAVADDREHPRVFRMTVTATEGAFRVDVSGIIHLRGSAAAPPALDPEGIAVTRDGHMLITSEGEGGEESHLPPSIIEYARDGTFIRQLRVRRRFLPAERGSMPSGVRDNAGFEALALAPDYSRLFTATELPLMQDGDVNAFAPGSRSRLLEYIATGDSVRAAA